MEDPAMDTDGMNLGPALTKLYGTASPEGATLERLVGDASTRTYYRLCVPEPSAGGPDSAIVMRLPEDAFASDEANSAAPPTELPFCNVQRLLRERGVPVPEVLAEDLPHRVLVLEDLGNTTFEAHLRATPRNRWGDLYGRAVDLLADMHGSCAPSASASLAHARRFDRALLRAELDHFREWGLEALHGPLPAGEAAALERIFDGLADEVARLPLGFVHRDYQSRNLMVRPSGDLVVIDFQDALQGPQCYDLVALLCDSYVTLDATMQETLLERYARRRGHDVNTLAREFWLITVQRKLKDAGRFVYIDRVRKNPTFLQWYGPSLARVGRALRRLHATRQTSPVAGLDALLSRRIPGFPDAVAAPAAQS
jgi:N-acetylmuramate 1-kinase